jgi:ribonuclease R
MSRKKKSKSHTPKARQLQQEVAKLFRASPRKRMTPRQVGKKLGTDANKDALANAIQKLVGKGILKPQSGNTFQYSAQPGGKDAPNTPRKVALGTVDMTRSGSAYIICDDLKDDVFVPSRNLRGAMDGDRVKVAIQHRRGARRADGEILEVVERAQEHFLGTLRIWKKYGIVTPDNIRSVLEISVPLKDLKGAEDGDKVVVRVTAWPERHNHNPVGEVTAVLGPEGSNEIAMTAILINNGFELEFPEVVMRESESLPVVIPEAEAFVRKDMRHVTTFTIDPVDAKDFDDALSVRHLDNGMIEVGIHIADVTHYVKPGTPLDQEAFKRSTSVYLVDRVLPMLPEKISNELCSLRPNEDKCTFSALITFDADYKEQDAWFGKTLTHSDRRFTYEEAQEHIDSGEGDFPEELRLLDKIAGTLRKRRFKNGAIAFESPEIRFQLDEQSKPVAVYRKERKNSHLLVEEFMLLANRRVAEFINKKGAEHEIPFVYRVHDSPDPERIEEFARFARRLGVSIDTASPKSIANSINALTLRAREESNLQLLEPLAIRTMAKAEYSTDNIGHYGLAFSNYTHFTSPIRRYSDVLSHRILENNLTGTYRENKAQLEDRCRHISKQERRATDAERESVKYKQVEFMESHIGEEFDGVISGMIDRGIFVALTESLCEGLVPFHSLQDSFEIDSGRLTATGIRTGRILRMGDTVRVKILDAQLERREIDMALVDTKVEKS